MANNRLFIKCRRCGHSVQINKTFGEPYHLYDDDVEELNEFFAEHAYCEPRNPLLSDGGYFELYDEAND